MRENGYADDEATTYSEYGYGEYLDELRASIRRNGFLIDPPATAASPFARYDQISLDIGRDGELLFDSNGCHRLTIAKTLGAEAVPVRLNAVHRNWYEAHGVPNSHPELTYLTRIPLPWRRIYTLETSPTDVPPFEGFRTGE